MANANCFFISFVNRNNMFYSKKNIHGYHNIFFKQPYNNQGFMLRLPTIADNSVPDSIPFAIMNFQGTGINNSITQWQSGFSYKKGDIVYTGANDETDTHYICVRDGISGATAPNLANYKIIEQPDAYSDVAWIYAPFQMIEVNGIDKRIKYQFNGQLPKINQINQNDYFQMSSIMTGIDEVNNQMKNKYLFFPAKEKNSRFSVSYTVSPNSSTNDTWMIIGFFVYSDWTQDPNLSNGYITLDYGLNFNLRPQLLKNEFDVPINSLDFNATTYRGALYSVVFVTFDGNGFPALKDYTQYSERFFPSGFALQGQIYQNGLNFFSIGQNGSYLDLSGAYYTKNTTNFTHAYTKNGVFQTVINDEDYGKRLLRTDIPATPIPSNWKLIPCVVTNNNFGEQTRYFRKYYHKIL